jgi:O-acetylserine/cysteine efflux transporter
VLQAQVVLTILLAALVLKERPTAAQSAGVALGVVGLLVVGAGRGGHVPLSALVLCLLGALMWAVGNVVSRASGATGGLALTVWSALVVPVPVLLLAVALDGPHTLDVAVHAFGWRAALSTLYTAGLASLTGYAIFNGLLGRNPSSAVVPWVLLVPPVSIGSAWLLLGERPSPAEVAGGVLLVVGVLVTLRRGSRPAPAPTPRTEDRPRAAPPAPSGSGVR